MNNGILFNWSVALGAWALGGPVWAVGAFIVVASVRIALASQHSRDESDAVRRRIASLSGAFGYVDEPPLDEPPLEEPVESLPSSETRTISGTMRRVRAAS